MCLCQTQPINRLHRPQMGRIALKLLMEMDVVPFQMLMSILLSAFQSRMKTALPCSYSPNPASDQVTILLEGNSANSAQIELLDNLGRVLQSIDASHKPSVNLQVNQLATGMYFVRFSTASEQRIEKLIVQ